MNIISKKSIYYKEFKAEVEFFSGQKYKNIHPIELSMALDRFMQRKIDKFSFTLLEDILHQKLT